MTADVPAEEKDRRYRALEALQASILKDLNRAYVGRTVDVLVEERHRTRWKGRTRTNRLVFFESDDDLRGRLAPVRVDWSGPWSLVGAPLQPAEILGEPVPADGAHSHQLLVTGAPAP